MSKFLFHLKTAMMSPRKARSHRQLMQNEHLSVDELEALNWSRRRDLVNFAFENNAFYKRKFSDVGFQLGDLKNPDDFSRLPILEKQEIRDNAEEMVSRGFDARKLAAATTGGSTGLPLKTYRDPGAADNEISWRTLNWWGVDIADSSAYLYRGIPSEMSQMLQKLLLWPTRRNWIAALDMDEERMESFFQKLLKDAPSYIIGYVGAIDVFADFMQRRGYVLDSLKAVWTTAAPLPEGKRLYMQEVLQSPVYTQYGSCEFYWIAAECQKQDGMHIAHDIRHVDVVDCDAPVAVEEYGDLVVTHLENRAFPLIRYRLGDRGRLLKNRCACGLPFPLMDYVDGRTSDRIHLPDGSIVAGEALGGIFRDFSEAIRSFHVHQSADYSLTVRYDPMPDFDCSAAIESIRARLNTTFRQQIDITFLPEKLTDSDNGKTRFFVSEVEA